MQYIQNEVHASPEVDWKKIKDVICGIEASLKVVCDMLPSGIVKSVVCGLAGVLGIVCNSIPNE